MKAHNMSDHIITTILLLPWCLSIFETLVLGKVGYSAIMLLYVVGFELGKDKNSQKEHLEMEHGEREAGREVDDGEGGSIGVEGTHMRHDPKDVAMSEGRSRSDEASDNGLAEFRGADIPQPYSPSAEEQEWEEVFEAEEMIVSSHASDTPVDSSLLGEKVFDIQQISNVNSSNVSVSEHRMENWNEIDDKAVAVKEAVVIKHGTLYREESQEMAKLEKIVAQMKIATLYKVKERKHDAEIGSEKWPNLDRVDIFQDFHASGRKYYGRPPLTDTYNPHMCAFQDDYKDEDHLLTTTPSDRGAEAMSREKGEKREKPRLMKRAAASILAGTVIKWMGRFYRPRKQIRPMDIQEDKQFLVGEDDQEFDDFHPSLDQKNSKRVKPSSRRIARQLKDKV